MNKSDKSSHQSIDFTETTRAQKTKLNICLLVDIYLQDAEHAWRHRQWRSTFIVLKAYHTEEKCIYSEEMGSGSLEIHFIELKRYEVKKKKEKKEKKKENG